VTQRKVLEPFDPSGSGVMILKPEDSEQIINSTLLPLGQGQLYECLFINLSPIALHLDDFLTICDHHTPHLILSCTYIILDAN